MATSEGEKTDETSGIHGTIQFGTTAVTKATAGDNMSLIKLHEDFVVNTLHVNGDSSTNVRDTYMLEADPMTGKAGAILKPHKSLGHKFFSGIDLVSGSGEGVLTNKN